MGRAPRVEILGKLPAPGKYLEVFRGRHPELGHELEFRLGAGESDEDPRNVLFLEELALLARVDHPSFPPVVDRGTYQGRPFAVLPLRREQPGLPALVEDEIFTTAHRCAAVVGLAAGLAELHRRGLAMGALHPALVAWRPAQRVPTLPYPLGARSLKPARGFPTLPEGRSLEDLPPRTRDVVLWALLSHWLIGRGGEVFFPDGSVVPFREDQVPVELGRLLEGALGEDPAERPADGVELHGVLGVLARDEDERVAARDPTRTEMTVEQGLDALRRRPAPTGAGEPEEGGVATWIRERWTRLGGRQRWAVALVWGGLCLLQSAAVLTPLIQSRARAARVAELEPPGGAEEGSALEDDTVRALVATEEVEPGDLKRLLLLYRIASRRRILPAGLDDAVRMQRIENLRETKPEAAAAAFAAWLAELRRAVGGARAAR